MHITLSLPLSNLVTAVSTVSFWGSILGRPPEVLPLSKADNLQSLWQALHSPSLGHSWNQGMLGWGVGLS